MPRVAATSTITYGNFTFDYNRMKVGEKTLYGQNGIDQIGIEYTFHIEGIISATNVADFEAAMQAATCQLHTPRLRFTATWSDPAPTVLFDIIPDADIGWGPKPQGLDINVIMAARSALFSWTLVARTKVCFDENCNEVQPANRSPVLSISRRYDHAVDENGLTTRTVSGKILIHAASIRDRNRQADFFRNLSVFAVPKWFNRTAESFQANEDGTEVDFSYTDREKMWTLPQPVSSGHATWRVTTSMFGSMASFMLAGKFTATTGNTKAELLHQISLLAANRFPKPGGAISYASTEKMVEEDIYENSVTFQISAEGACGDTTSFGAEPANWTQPVYATFGVQPIGSDGRAQAIGVYGGDGNVTSGVIANTPTPFDACNPPFTISSGGSPGSPKAIGVTSPGTITSGTTPGTTGVDPEPPGTIVPINLGISTAHAQAPYISYYEEISYEIDNHISIFYPKKRGAKPIKQQTQNPSMKIVQCGYARRYGQSSKQAPDFPDPIFPEAIILRPSLTPAVPESVGNGGWNVYKINWRYVMEYPDVVTDEALDDLTFPLDVRRPGTTPEDIVNFPDLIEA